MDSFSNIGMMQLAILAISFFLLLHSPSSTNATILKSPSKLVDGVCKQTRNYTDCVSALDRDPRTPSTSDLKNLARIALEIAIANTTNSKAYIEKMDKNKRTAPSLRPVLKKCKWGYWHAAASFDSARMELDEDMMTANYDAKVASDGAVLCETWLNSSEWNVPSIRVRNYYINLFSDIGFAITDMLDG